MFEFADLDLYVCIFTRVRVVLICIDRILICMYDTFVVRAYCLYGLCWLSVLHISCM